MVELTHELKIAIEVAMDEARYRRQEFAGTEHLLLALLNDRVSANTIRRCGGDVSALKKESRILSKIPFLWCPTISTLR